METQSTDTTKRICCGCGQDQTPLGRGIQAVTYTNGSCAGLFGACCIQGADALIMLDANGRPGGIYLEPRRQAEYTRVAAEYRASGGKWEPNRFWRPAM
jgi:hypothetical protein